MHFNVEPSGSLEAKKSAARKALRDEATLARSKWLTLDPGKDVEYLRKYMEALEYTSSGNASGLPYILAESDRMGVSHEDVASTFISKAAECAVAGAAIDKALKISILAVEESLSASQVSSALSFGRDSIRGASLPSDSPLADTGP